MMLYKIVYRSVHAIIALYFFIGLQIRNFHIFLRHCLSLLPSFLKLQNSLRYTFFKKVPSHLGIIIYEDIISFSDISNLIVWNSCVGIRHISMYDSKGFIKSKGKELCKVANSLKEIILKKRACNVNIIFTNGRTQYPFNTIIRNGHKTDDIYVYLLSPEDGKEQIVNAARSVCTEARSKPSVLENFHSKQFGKYINDVLNIPDPELILVFGEAKGLMGYLPWHVRLSEILFQSTHRNISLKEFQNTLSRFNRCEQRFGK